MLAANINLYTYIDLHINSAFQLQIQLSIYRHIYGGPEVHTSSIRQAFGDSSLLRFERAFDDSNEPSTIRTSLRRFEHEPSAIRGGGV